MYPTNLYHRFLKLFVATIVIVLGGVFADVAAQAPCGTTPEFDNLMNAISSIQTQDSSTTVRNQRQLAARVDLDQLQTRLRQMGRSDLIAPALFVSRFTRQITTSSQLVIISPEMIKLRNGIEAACEQQASAHTNIFQSLAQSIGLARKIDTPESVRTPIPGIQKLIYVIVVLIKIILVILISYRMYLWVFARINVRSSCTIPAQLWIDGQSFEGTVKVLGRRGCMFRPTDKLTLDVVAAKCLVVGTFVVIGDTAIPSILHTKSDSACAMFFEIPNSTRVTRRLLQFSTDRAQALTTRPSSTNLPIRKVTSPRASYRRSAQ
jgi:hypothetical protein